MSAVGMSNTISNTPHPHPLYLALVSSAETSVLLVSTAALMTSFHSAGGLLLPQDMCPDYVGSMFGIMNTGGAMAGNSDSTGVVAVRYTHNRGAMMGNTCA